MRRSKKIFLAITAICLLIAIFFGVNKNYSQAATANLFDRQVIVNKIKELTDLIAKLQKQLNDLLSKNSNNEASYLSTISQKDLNVSNSGISDKKEYFQEYIKVSSKVAFSTEELNFVKSKDGNILTLENLIESAKDKKDITDLRSSFLSWKNLDDRLISQLEKIPVKGDVVNIHQELISWLNFHSIIAQKFADSNLNKEQINNLSKEFTENANVHLKQYEQNVNSAELGKITLVNKAEATTCAAVRPPNFYHIGGRIIIVTPVMAGLVIIISPPCGGIIHFNWASIIASPYIYKFLIPSYSILGKVILVPGTDFTPTFPPAPVPFEGEIVYYGTSVSPR